MRIPLSFTGKVLLCMGGIPLAGASWFFSSQGESASAVKNEPEPIQVRASAPSSHPKVLKVGSPGKAVFKTEKPDAEAAPGPMLFGGFRMRSEDAAGESRFGIPSSEPSSLPSESGRFLLSSLRSDAGLEKAPLRLGASQVNAMGFSPLGILGENANQSRTDRISKVMEKLGLDEMAKKGAVVPFVNKRGKSWEYFNWDGQGCRNQSVAQINGETYHLAGYFVRTQDYYRNILKETWIDAHIDEKLSKCYRYRVNMQKLFPENHSNENLEGWLALIAVYQHPSDPMGRRESLEPAMLMLGKPKNLKLAEAEGPQPEDSSLLKAGVK